MFYTILRQILKEAGKSSFLDLVLKSSKGRYVSVKSLQGKSLKQIIKEGFSTNLKNRLNKALRRPALREQWKRTANWKNIKSGFKTLGLDYIKKQLWFARNQAQLYGKGAKMVPIKINNSMPAQMERKIIQKIISRPHKQVIDNAMLNSSWLYSGTWIAHVG
jgi:hypothetical protein